MKPKLGWGETVRISGGIHRVDTPCGLDSHISEDNKRFCAFLMEQVQAGVVVRESAEGLDKNGKMPKATAKDIARVRAELWVRLNSGDLLSFTN